MKKKTKDMWICLTDSVQEPPSIQIGDDIIERVKTFQLLGVCSLRCRRYRVSVMERYKRLRIRRPKLVQSRGYSHIIKNNSFTQIL